MPSADLLWSQSAPTPEPRRPRIFLDGRPRQLQPGHFEAAHPNLDQLALPGNPYRQQAADWLMALSAGMAHGWIDWAAILEQSSLAAANDPDCLRRQAASARKAADHYTMRLAEPVAASQAGPRGIDIPLDINFPAAIDRLPAAAERLPRLLTPDSAEAATLGVAVRSRAVVLSLCRLVDAESDAVRARAMLIGSHRLKPQAFEWYLAQELDALSELYSPRNWPRRRGPGSCWGRRQPLWPSAASSPRQVN